MKFNRRKFLAGGASLLARSLGPSPLFASAGTMTVYKDPNCGCCHLWAEAVAKAGYDVSLQDVEDLAPIKARFGVPDDLQSCHTAEIDGYFIEGHVPLSSLRRLLAERPAIKGLAVPGMLSGSLGMGDDPGTSYDVVALGSNGAPFVYEAVRPKS